MSSENKNINVLENFISKPNSLEAERVGRSYFLDNHADVIPNEGNLMSLLTLQKFYKDDTKTENKEITQAIKAIGTNESKYLVEAMKILTAGKGSENGLDDDGLKTAHKLQQKFGSNFNASLGLAQMLKTKSDEKEFNSLMDPIVEKLSAYTKRNTFV